MVYQQQGLTRFNPEIPVLRSALPHVRLIELWFVQPSAANASLDRDLAEKMTLTFINGTQLNVDGEMLWKLCDAVIPGLGTADRGYDETNKFCSMQPVALAESIRIAYLAMFEKKDPAPGYWPPVRATLDLERGTVQRIEAARLAPGVRERLKKSAVVREVPDATVRLLACMQVMVRNALDGNRAVIERDPEGGVTRERFVEKPWPHKVAESMSLKEFLKEIGPAESMDCRRSWGEIFAEQVGAEVATMVGRCIEHMRHASPDVFKRANEQLRLGLVEDEPVDMKRVSEVIERTPEYAAFASILTGIVQDPYLDQSLKRYMELDLI